MCLNSKTKASKAWLFESESTKTQVYCIFKD